TATTGAGAHAISSRFSTARRSATATNAATTTSRGAERGGACSSTGTDDGRRSKGPRVQRSWVPEDLRNVPRDWGIPGARDEFLAQHFPDFVYALVSAERDR